MWLWHNVLSTLIGLWSTTPPISLSHACASLDNVVLKYGRLVLPVSAEESTRLPWQQNASCYSLDVDKPTEWVSILTLYLYWFFYLITLKDKCIFINMAVKDRQKKKEVQLPSSFFALKVLVDTFSDANMILVSDLNLVVTKKIICWETSFIQHNNWLPKSFEWNVEHLYNQLFHFIFILCWVINYFYLIFYMFDCSRMFIMLHSYLYYMQESSLDYLRDFYEKMGDLHPWFHARQGNKNSF